MDFNNFQLKPDNLIRRIKKFIKRLIRAWKYAKQGYYSEDWDYQYILDDLQFKLKRVYHELTTSGIAKHDKQCLLALKRCIQLLDEKCDNLDHNYGAYFTKDGKLSLGYELSKERYVYVNHMLFKLLEKHHESWWD